MHNGNKMKGDTKTLVSRRCRCQTQSSQGVFSTNSALGRATKWTKSCEKVVWTRIWRQFHDALCGGRSGAPRKQSWHWIEYQTKVRTSGQPRPHERH